MSSCLNKSRWSWCRTTTTKSFFCFDHSFDPIIHILNKIFFRSTESSFVRDVENSIVSFSMLTMDTSYLNIVFICNFLKLDFVLRKHWKFDMNWCSQSCSEICWAWCDVSEVLVVSELCFLFDLRCCNRQSFENCSDVGSLLHRDDSELIFLVDPNQKRLFFVVENASARWPVSVETWWLKEPVAFFEQEVISDELGLLFFRHSCKCIVCSFKLTSESFASSRDKLFDFVSLFFWNTRTEREISKISSNSDSCW